MIQKLSSYSFSFLFITFIIITGNSVKAGKENTNFAERKIDSVLEKDFKKLDDDKDDDDHFRKPRVILDLLKTSKHSNKAKGAISSRKNSNSNASSSNNMGSLSSISSLQDSPPSSGGDERVPLREERRSELPLKEPHEEIRLEE
jgi:hypothetical protein